MHGTRMGYESRQKCPAERRLTFVVVLLALCTILPVGKMVRSIPQFPEMWKANALQAPTPEQERAFWAAMNETEARLKCDDFYSATEYVPHLLKLRRLSDHFINLNTIADKRIQCLLNRSRADYLKRARSHDVVSVNWEFNSDFNTAQEQDQSLNADRDAGKKLLARVGRWLGRSYVIMMPFAFILFLISLYFRKMSIKEEMLLAPHRMLLSLLFWPFGLAHYNDGAAAVWYRRQKLEAKYRLATGKGWDRLTQAEEEMIRRESRKRIDDFDALVSDLTNVPVETIRQQSRAMAFLTLTLSIVLAPMSFARVNTRSDESGKSVAVKIIPSENGRSVELKKVPTKTTVTSDDGQGGGSHLNLEMSAIIPPSCDYDFFMLVMIASNVCVRPPPGPVSPIDYVPKLVVC